MDPRQKVLSLYEVTRRLELFGVPAPEALELLRRGDLEEVKRRVKAVWKKRAFAEHPDRGGDEDRFKALSAAYELLMELRPAAPPRRPVVVQVWSSWGGMSSTTTNTSTSTGGGGWPWW